MFTHHGPELDAELAYRRETLLRRAPRVPVEGGWLRHLRFPAPRTRG